MRPKSSATRTTTQRKATKAAPAPRATAKPAPRATAKPAPRATAKPAPGANENVVLLAGGNPQVAKGDGDAPVHAYIAAMPGWKRDIGKRLDALIVRTVPSLEKAVKWNSPFYGVAGQGWFLSFHVFTHYVKITFFRGAALRPLPPGASKQPDVRSVDIREGELDEARMTT